MLLMFHMQNLYIYSSAKRCYSFRNSNLCLLQLCTGAGQGDVCQGHCKGSNLLTHLEVLIVFTIMLAQRGLGN